MLKFRKYFVAVFATLLAVAASAADVPYRTNLLQNTNPDGTTFDPWSKTDGGSGWAISDGKFLSSYMECVLTQTVNLKDLKLTTGQTDSLTMLSIVNYEIPWPGDYECIAKVIITCKDSDGNNLSVQSLLDINQSNIEVSATLATKSFLLPKGTTQLVYEVHGKSQNNWGGQYGPRFWGMYVGFVDLTKTYTASTYTASAVAALGDSLVFSQTDGIKALDPLTVTSKYSDVRIKSISSENSIVISSNQAMCIGSDMTINAEFYRKHSIVASSSEYGTITIKKNSALYGDTIVVNHAMNSGFAFVRFTSTSNLTWLTSSTFIMPDEDVTIGIEAMRANELPFYEGFENGNTQGQNIVGWLQQSEYGNNSWTANSTNIPYSGSWNATLCYGNTDWLFTPVNLVKGEMYVFSVYARRDGFGNTGFYTRISAKIGTAADQDSMKQVVLANTVVADGDYQHIVGYFTADTGGVCWLGVRGYAGNYFGMDLSIDSVSLEKVKSRKVVAENNYGTISVKDSALYGDTITVSHTMNSDTVFFVGYTTTPDLSWVNDSTFIMPDEDVTIGMKVLKPQMPLREGFENGNTRGQNVVGWLHQSESEDNKCWIAVGTTPYSGSWDALLKLGTIAWIFTPVNLEKGVRYAFTIYSRTSDNAGANISAKIGTAADKDSMKYVVMAKTGVADGDYQRLDNFFTSDTSGVCWLGIRGYTHRFCESLVIDSISFEKAVEHTITTKKEYGTIKVNKDNALFGDTITVSRRMNNGFAFVNYTTTSVVTWLTDSTFIMPNEDVTIGMEVMKPHEIPFYEGFENGNTSGQPVVGWLQQFESEATSYWGAYNNDSTYNRAPYSGSWNASLFKQYYSSYDNVTSWLFTPVNLEKGKNYMFSIYARQYKGSTILGCTAEITVKLGTAAPNKDSMKQVVTMSNTCIRRSDNYQRLVGYVIADTSGACWLGIRGSLTDADGVLCLSIDSISLVEAETRTITIVESEYGTISAIQKAEYGDTITVSPIMNSDTVRFAGYTTTPKLTWVNDSTFIMPDEDVTIGMEIYKRHTIVASASEYGIIAIRKDTALCGDTITVSHTVNEVLMGDSLRFAGYTTTPNLTWVNDSTFIMPDEDVIIGVEIYKKHTIVASASEYGIIAIRKDTAFCGDTIPVSHTMNSGFVFVNYTTTAAVTWLTDSTFIMPNENVTVGMEVMKVNEIPFYEGFENNSTQGQQVVGWLHECGYIWFSWTANSTETEYNRTPYSGSWNATLSSGNLSWIFTPVNLVKGTKYVFCIYARQDKRYYWHVNISAKIGMAPNRGSMKQNVLSETDVTNGDYQRIESSFVADTSGVCWLGIKGNVGSIANYLSIDSISLVAIEGWHAITAEDEYGTFNIESGAVKDETVIVKHTMKPGYAFTGYVTAPEVKWTSDTTFIMPDEEVVITMTATKIDCAITIADTENGTVKSSDATAQIDDIVKLTITPSVGYTLDEITILQNGNMTTFNAEDSTFVMSGGDVEISATFRKVDYTILVHESENGAVIASATAQMDDAVKLTITPAVGYTLDEITILQNGDMVTFNTEDSTFVMPADSVEISATFRKDDYAILVHESENGMVTSNVTAQMDDVVKLAITPAVGYTLDEITISQNGDKVAFNAEDSTFIMPAGDVEISVTFTKIDYTITIGESENGSVVSNNATAQMDDVVKLTITPAVGYTLDEITISQNGDKVAFNAEDSTFVMPADSVEIFATFKKIDYTILVKEFENGTVTSNATAQMDDVVKLAITPATGYTLDEITISQKGDKVVFNVEDSTFIMPAGDVEISATFTKIDYSISIGESENGSVVSNKATAQIGDTVKLTITSAVGYTIDEITISQTGDKVAFNAEDSTFVMSGGNVEISATFKKIDYNITIGESENGSVSTKATAQKGEWVELAITPEPGYVLDEITILHNGGKVAFNAKYSIFVMPAGDVTISATFKQSTIVEDVKILNLYVADGRIYCEGEFRIYDLLGRDVTAMNGSLYGVYIVRTKDASRKVIVE